MISMIAGAKTADMGVGRMSKLLTCKVCKKEMHWMNFDCSIRKVCYDCADIHVSDVFNQPLSVVDDFAYYNESNDCW